MGYAIRCNQRGAATAAMPLVPKPIREGRKVIFYGNYRPESSELAQHSAASSGSGLRAERESLAHTPVSPSRLLGDPASFSSDRTIVAGRPGVETGGLVPTGVTRVRGVADGVCAC